MRGNEGEGGRRREKKREGGRMRENEGEGEGDKIKRLRCAVAFIIRRGFDERGRERAPINALVISMRIVDDQVRTFGSRRVGKYSRNSGAYIKGRPGRPWTPLVSDCKWCRTVNGHEKWQK